MRDYYNKKIKILTLTQPILKTIIQALKKIIPKAISVTYDCMMQTKNKSTIYIKTKWESEMGEMISTETWNDVEESLDNNTVFWMEGIFVEKPNKIFYNSSYQK